MADLDPLAHASLGCTLEDIGGRAVGTVEGVLADVLEGEPTWVLVRTRRFGRRSCVPAPAIAVAGGRAWAPYSREAIRASAEVETSGGLTCGDERALAEHFGFPSSAPRLLAISSREDEDDGSVPL